MNSAIQATRDRTATEKGPQHAINTRQRCCAKKVAKIRNSELFSSKIKVVGNELENISSALK